MLWIDKYRPKNLDDYVGDQYNTLLFYIDKFYSGDRGRGFILFGSPGTGKSALIEAVANHYDAESIIINASDTRSKINISRVLAGSLVGKRKIVVFEEVDGFDKFDELEKIIEISINPVILICNEIGKIPSKITKICYQKQIVTDRFALKELARRVIKSENLNISENDLNQALNTIKTYRDLLNWLQFGIISEKESFDKTTDLQSEITFAFDNSDNPDLISLVDIYMKRSRLGYKRGEEISRYILNNINVERSDYPRTYRLIHEARNKKPGKMTMKFT